MSNRVSGSQRIEMQHVAEKEVMRYAGDHALWHKHVHNLELDAVQLLKMAEMDQHPNTIDFSSRRTGKTAGKEVYAVEYNATHPDQELGIVAPREAQSIVNLTYHIDAIRRSPILTAFLAHKSGRVQMSDTRYEFFNRSKAQGYGIMSQVDGGDLTVASLEEVDDMPKDRLFSRFLLMLGSTRRMGASKSSANKPQIRITGVFKGADTLTDLLEGGNYHALGCFHGKRARQEIKKMIKAGWLDADAVELESYKYPVPINNAPNAIALGFLQEAFVNNIRGDIPEDDFIRQLLCVNTASRNLVWAKYMQLAIQTGVGARLELAEPMPGQTYKKKGIISFGYDHTGHGETPQSSKSALVVLEQIGQYSCPIFAKTWPAGTDERIISNDLKGLWRYFMPDQATGDAYGIGMLTILCDELFAEGLTPVDRRTIGDGESTASTWGEWPFAPIRFEGMAKHSMAQAVRAAFHHLQAAIPYVDSQDLKTELEKAIWLMICQIVNIVPVATKTSYSSYKMANAKLGDDLFDAFMAALWGLVTRGAIIAPSAIIISQQTREQLLGTAIEDPLLQAQGSDYVG
jgi:hypothetical protein